MNVSLTVRISALALLAACPLSAGQINFVYPPEGSSLPQVAKTFVFGNVSPATAPFTINGEKISVYKNGGFIAYLPVSGGDFAFKGALSDGTTAQRGLKVRQAEAPAPVSTGTLRLEFTSNASDSELLAGDYIRITAAGTPGRQAVASLEGVFSDLAMIETPPGSGRYSAYYRVKDSDSCQGAQLSARFKAGLFGHGASARSKGKVRIAQQLSLVETYTDTVILRNAPEGGYMLFLGKGVKLLAAGRNNGMRRVLLSPTETGWVEDSKVQYSGPAVPSYNGTETGAIKLRRTDTGSSAAVTMYERVPYKAEVLENGLRVTLYYANLHTNWVVYDSSDTLVKNVSFRQTGSNTVEIDFETAPGALWGYNIGYANGSKSLVVDLRARPKASLSWPRPLAGVSVVLDPGHSPKTTPPYDGAIGPMASFEYQVNLAIAKKAQEKLLALGATVQMTRNGDENVPLADRPKIAQALGGDIFISIHNNAIGDGEDPFAQPRGFSVYHYQRHSRALAAALHRAYLKDIALPDEGLRYGDYLVARMTWMPAALIENAYMILPEQEAMLNSPEFQDKLGAAIAEGVLNFFGAPERPAPPAPRKKGKK